MQFLEMDVTGSNFFLPISAEANAGMSYKLHCCRGRMTTCYLTDGTMCGVKMFTRSRISIISFSGMCPQFLVFR
jgi:hypothetical protein